MPNPIGISFLPSADAAEQGPRQGNMEGDLGQALQILSLRLPRILGAHSISPPGLMNAQGAAGAGGFNPMQAVIQALLAAGGGGGGQGMGGGAQGPMGIGGQLGPTAPPPPRIIPGGGDVPIGPEQPVAPPRLPGFSPNPPLDRTMPGSGSRPPGDILKRGPWNPY
jgi:hypothetical protein